MINKKLDSKPALITKEKTYSYSELFSEINKYSQLFKGKDYTNVAIHSENRAEWIFAFYAAWYNKCTVVPIDFLASVDDVSYIINDCQPEIVFISNETNKKIDKIQTKLKYNPIIVNLDDLNIEPTKDEIIWNVPENANDTAVIIYTSGTTGSPKGVMLSYTNLIANIKGVSEDVKIYNPDRQVLVLLPLHHIFPLAGSMAAPLYVGGTIVMSPSMQSSDILETLKNNKVNIMIGVPRLYELLYKGIKAKIDAKFIGRLFFKIVKLSKSQKLARKIFKQVHAGFGGNLEYMVSGGAALPKTVGGFFQTLGFDVLEGFGMTEAAPMITFTRPGNGIIGSPGQPLPGLKMEIRDGEIVAKGPNVMKGYYKRPEETAEMIKDGWLYTGDLGYVNKKGFLFITGRKKEIMVLPNGKNVNPAELEEKLEKIEYVKEAGVFLQNDLIHAVIIPDYEVLSKKEIKDPEKLFKEEVMPEFNSHLTSYKRIMKYSLSKDEIPRTRLGKVQRFKLSEMFEKPAKKKSQSEHPLSEEFIAIKTFLESQVDLTISPDDHLEFDLALDSLSKITLIDFIERTFGVKIPEDKLLSFPSIGKMVEHIKENKVFHTFEMHNWSAIIKEKINLKLPKSWPTQALIIKFFRNFFRFYFRLKGEGLENIPEGAVIFTPNHQSYIDGLCVTGFLKWRTIKETYFYAKRKHIQNKFLDFMANRNNVIIMDVNTDLKESIQKMAEVLKQGKKIVIFPEGTRTADGKLGEFKKTFAILSKELNVPVVPVAIKGAYKALPRGSKFPRPFTKIYVSYLPPIYPQDYDFDSLAQKVKDLIAEKIL
ncbi:MAG: long-chain fatty acid--CoA ligase [Bacteroidetes bacterium GWF2_33_16]|nr:MAG: long-chain fatty acid--CoA ligase [Bacteroidetes bacterium GWE2_32_14]OFY06364.1 MAG: long-chain fatty acid--CoA ligase [Bacteroidetes bacterium GWF2_33_16]